MDQTQDLSGRMGAVGEHLSSLAPPRGGAIAAGGSAPSPGPKPVCESRR